MSWQREFSREYSVQYCENIWKCFLKEGLDGVIPGGLDIFLFPDNKNIVCYCDEKEIKNVCNALVKVVFDKKLYEELTNIFFQVADDYLNYSKDVFEKDPSGFSKTELIKYYLGYQKRMIDFTVGVWHFHKANDSFGEVANLLFEKLVGVNNEKRGVYLNVLFSPEKENFVSALRKRAVKIDKNNRDEVRKLLKECEWMPCLDLHNKPWDEKDLLGFIGHINTDEEIGMSYEEAIKELNLNDEDKFVFDRMRYLAYMKDMRDYYRRRTIFFIRPLFLEMAKRVGVRIEELAYLTEDEIIESLNGKNVDLDLVNKRMNGFMMFADNGKTVCIVDDIEKVAKEMFNFELNVKDVNELRGLGASKGMAKGKVKIVRGVGDLNDVLYGDIMIAITTHPDFLPAMERAAAIVTEEGGLTCHAAIVSRELGIPCIVGVRDAAKVFKSEDEVEVDANKGRVRKIE